MNEYLSLGPQIFWEKWTVDGKRAKVDYIKMHLKDERHHANDIEYEEIKEKEPGFVDSQQYHSKGVVKKVSSRSSIVEQHRKLQTSRPY